MGRPHPRSRCRDPHRGGAARRWPCGHRGGGRHRRSPSRLACGERLASDRTRGLERSRRDTPAGFDLHRRRGGSSVTWRVGGHAVWRVDGHGSWCHLHTSRASRRGAVSVVSVPGADALRDPWIVLGLRPGASPEAVARAWRTLAARHHPDAGGDPDLFRELVAARDRLTASATSSRWSQERVTVVARPTRAVRMLRPLRRRIDRRLNPRVR